MPQGLTWSLSWPLSSFQFASRLTQRRLAEIDILGPRDGATRHTTPLLIVAHSGICILSSFDTPALDFWEFSIFNSDQFGRLIEVGVSFHAGCPRGARSENPASKVALIESLACFVTQHSLGTL